MKRVRKSYTCSNLMKALQDVKDGKYSITMAAKIYDIPRQTLSDKVKGRSPAVYCKPGPHPLLGIEIEERLKNWAILNKESGFITTKDSILFSVQKIIEANFQPGMHHYFKSRSLGIGWFKSFRKRNSEIAVEKMESCFSYTEVTKNELKLWFRKVRKYLGKDAEILIDPDRIFCLGELILPMYSLAKRSSIPPCDKENVMVLFAANADAKFAPPLLNFKCNSSAKFYSDSVIVDSSTIFTTAGKITCEIFYNYITQILYPHLLKQNIEFPIVLYVDARIARTSLTLHEFCQEKGIHLISFLPNAINIIHPFQIEFFNIFKKMWDTEVEFWPARNNNVPFKAENAETAVSNIMQFTEFSNTIRKAFRKCGLFPFDVKAVDFSANEKEPPQSTNSRPLNESNSRISQAIRDSKLGEIIVDNYIIEDYVDDFDVPESNSENDSSHRENISDEYANINNIFIDSDDDDDDSIHRISPLKRKGEALSKTIVKKMKSELPIKMTESNSDLNIKVEDVVATENDGYEIIKKKNQDLKSLLEKVIDLLKEKTNVCVNLEKQNSALNLQISSLKDIVSITKNLLNIRNMEVENMQKDMTSLQEKINAEKERHNKMIETVSSANKLNEDIKGEYQNQMNLFQQLREKYNEKVALLTQENQKLKTELEEIKLKYENENETNESQ